MQVGDPVSDFTCHQQSFDHELLQYKQPHNSVLILRSQVGSYGQRVLDVWQNIVYSKATSSVDV